MKREEIPIDCRTSMTIDLTTSKGLEVSAYVQAPFDRAKEILERYGYQIISLSENLRLIIADELKEHVFTRGDAIGIGGNYTREGFLYVPNEGIFLTKKSPIMKYSIEATKCHRKRPQPAYKFEDQQEFYLSKEQLEEAWSDKIKATDESIPLKRFGENEMMIYLFGGEENAQMAGNSLYSRGSHFSLPIHLSKIPKGKPFARQLYFSGDRIDYAHDISGGYQDLSLDNRVRGIQNIEVYLAEKK